MRLTYRYGVISFLLPKMSRDGARPAPSEGRRRQVRYSSDAVMHGAISC